MVMGIRTTDETKLTLSLPHGVLVLHGPTEDCSISADAGDVTMLLRMYVDMAQLSTGGITATESLTAVGRCVVAETPLGPAIGKVKWLSIEGHPRFTGTIRVRVTA
jgi:hypothetical protein